MNGERRPMWSLLCSRRQLRMYTRRRNRVGASYGSCPVFSPTTGQLRALLVTLLFFQVSVNALLRPHMTTHSFRLSALPLRHRRAPGRPSAMERCVFVRHRWTCVHLEATPQLNEQDTSPSTLLHTAKNRTPEKSDSKEESESSSLQAFTTRLHPASSSSTTTGKLQQLKESVDIVAVVESYQLHSFKRNGNRAVAVCPFHNDRNPSLSIDSTRQIYKCFSCGAGGDVFRFVQDYSRLPGQNELTFGQAVQHVSSSFGYGSIGGPMYIPKVESEVQQRLQRKKERILSANAAAAAFYCQCLKEPSAGGARSHLRSRGISLSSIRAFAIGFAPDQYFDGRAGWGDGSLVHHLRDLGFTVSEIVDAGLATNRTKKWSQREYGETKAAARVLNSSDAVADSKVNLEYSSLIDRFRARIMVPIFDDSGAKIVGFGGRVVPSPEADAIDVKTSDFKAPKYLNSPESEVFEKKTILFGHHLARQTIRDADIGATARATPLILVEGYMDAILLWDVGIGSVASMGTAVSKEQLDVAAKAAGSRGGRIVLCLDSDEAGVAAVKRLCTNGILAECVKKHVVTVAVARLPDGFKDPGHFIESRYRNGFNTTRIADDFQREVIDYSVDWTDWFIRSVVGEYDRDAPRGGTGSFNDIFERVADFLASTMRPADRTKRAYEVSALLSDILAKERNSTDISTAVVIQLEADLIDLASRLSEAKEAIQRRAESVGGPSSTLSRLTLLSLSKGHGPNSSDQESKLSKKSLPPVLVDNANTIKRTAATSFRRSEPRALTKTSVRVHPKSARAKLTRKRDVESLTPHFAGFRFHHQSDSDWLGLQQSEKAGWKGQSNKLLLGHRPLTASGRRDAQRHGLGGGSAQLNENLIYFNSADFNGHQFLTDDAMHGGYGGRAITPDASFIDKGISSLVEPDIARLIVSAEDTLLRIMVTQSPVRTTVKNMLNARSAIRDGGIVQLSSPAKQWLFDCLAGNADHPEENVGHPDKLRSYLAQLVDAPPGAFSTESVIDATPPLYSDVDRGDSVIVPPDAALLFEKATIQPKPSLSTRGLLDAYFVQEQESDAALLNDTIVGSHGKLAVQELLVTLLWASTAMKAKLIRQELAASFSDTKPMRLAQPCGGVDSSGQLPNSFMESQGSSSLASKDVESIHFDSLQSNGDLLSNGDALLDALGILNATVLVGVGQATSRPQLDSYQSELFCKLRDTTRTLQSLKDSSKRITVRLMDESSSTGVEGSMSPALQAELASRLDDHVRDIFVGGEAVSAGVVDGSFVPVQYEEPYEAALERMASDWGEWFDDEYVWAPGDGSSNGQDRMYDSGVMDNNGSALERETLDEFFERVDREWEGWDDDDK